MPGKVVSQSEWTAARVALLQKEKELVKANDALAAQRRDLPMVKIDKEYKFKGPNGTVLSLGDLFAGKDQLIVYHFMFGPDAEEGCHGCAFMGEHIPDTRHLRAKNTSMVCVSRAPFEKLNSWKQKLGWTFPWYSSEGSDFNYDFHATLDENIAPIEYNYSNKDDLLAKDAKWNLSGEQPGLSVYLKKDGEIYHTYSSYSRGLDKLIGTMQLLDMTPLGRQDGPSGPAEFKLNYEYGADD